MNLKEKLNEEHSGFVVTFEVMITLVIIFSFIFMNTYVLGVMNCQRYMNTVATSSATIASRWGGNNSKAYKANVSSSQNVEQLITSQVAQKNASGGYKNLPFIENNSFKITVSPNAISPGNTTITVTVYYKISGAFASLGQFGGLIGKNNIDMYRDTGGNKVITIKVQSIMKPGTLV